MTSMVYAAATLYIYKGESGERKKRGGEKNSVYHLGAASASLANNGLARQAGAAGRARAKARESADQTGENAPGIVTWPRRIRALGRDFAVLFVHLCTGSGVSGAIFLLWVGTSGAIVCAPVGGFAGVLHQ